EPGEAHHPLPGRQGRAGGEGDPVRGAARRGRPRGAGRPLRRGARGRALLSGHHRQPRGPRVDARRHPPHGGEHLHSLHRGGRHPLGRRLQRHPGCRCRQGGRQHRRAGRPRPGAARRRPLRLAVRGGGRRRPAKPHGPGGERLGGVHARRPQADGDRRGRMGPAGAGAGRGRDPADLHGPGRHPRRLRPAAAGGGQPRGAHSRDRLRRRGGAGAPGQRPGGRRARRAGGVDLPLRRVHAGRGAPVPGRAGPSRSAV
ncbi:MAG: Imidazole glycerol phosphate synthase cyclase subunit HisF, partial [uncultured Gemmatimonadetes bacterium]